MHSALRQRTSRFFQRLDEIIVARRHAGGRVIGLNCVHSLARPSKDSLRAGRWIFHGVECDRHYVALRPKAHTRSPAEGPAIEA